MPQIFAGADRIKKMYLGADRIKKAYIGSQLIYTAAVAMTNLAGTEAGTCFHTADASTYGTSVSHNLLTVASTAGHRYFIRWSLGQWGEFDGGPTNQLTLNPDGTVLASSGGKASEDGMAIVTASGGTFTLNHNGWMKTFAGYSAGLKAALYMVVDITQYEADTGTTYTPESFWEAIGSAVFYGGKEFDI